MRMRHSAVCLLISVLCGVSHAEPFHSYYYFAGGGEPPTLGGFAVDFGGFFVAQDADNGVRVAGAGLFTQSNEFEFDSHFTIAVRGPSVRNRTIRPEDNSNVTLQFYGDYGPPGGPAANYDEGEDTPGYLLNIGPDSDTLGITGERESSRKTSLASSSTRRAQRSFRTSRPMSLAEDQAKMGSSLVV